jgi:hypothetical protein
MVSLFSVFGYNPAFYCSGRNFDTAVYYSNLLSSHMAKRSTFNTWTKEQGIAMISQSSRRFNWEVYTIKLGEWYSQGCGRTRARRGSSDRGSTSYQPQLKANRKFCPIIAVNRLKMISWLAERLSSCWASAQWPPRYHIGNCLPVEVPICRVHLLWSPRWRLYDWSGLRFTEIVY